MSRQKAGTALINLIRDLLVIFSTFNITILMDLQNISSQFMQININEQSSIILLK